MNVSFAEPCLRPAWLKNSRPRGVKALGLRYERAVAKALPEATHGQWFRYLLEGDREPRWCQTDLLWKSATRTLVLEVKLSYTDAGMIALQNMYLPVVRKAFGLPVGGIQICKNLRPGIQVPIFSTLALAEASAKLAQPCVLHWMGKGPL